MKKLLRGFLFVILILTFAFSGVIGCGGNGGQTQKTIDIYLIAGQSNAVGYSKMVSDTTYLEDPFITEITKEDKRVTEGFPNVLCAVDGQSGNIITYHNKIEWTKLTLGCGRNSNCIGVEVGMALSLSERYTETNAMGIIKLGHGGTNLLDVLGGENFPEGNWAPPSYLKTVENAGEKSGGLYREFVDFVVEQVNAVKELGYIPTVKGLFWMQGEADVWLYGDYDANSNKYYGMSVGKVHNVYKEVFGIFMSDLRSELAEKISPELIDMPVFIGELSRSFAGSNNAGATSALTKFIKMQDTIPNSVPNAYIIGSSLFDMNIKDPQTGAETVVGSDKHHWCCRDITNIGKLIGDSIKTNVLDKSAEK